MISLRKLISLSEGTRMRKYAALLAELERILAVGGDADPVYWNGVLRLIAKDEAWPENIRFSAAAAADDFSASSQSGMNIRTVNSLRHALLAALGRDWADWDMESPGDRGRYESSEEGSAVFPFRVYLDGLRSPFNVGSILRTCLAFGVEHLWASPDGAAPDHPRSKRSSMGAADGLSWDIRDLDELTAAETGPLFALELGGAELKDFAFPASGTVVLGSEELGVSPKKLERAERSAGIVSIGLPGLKASLNVGVAFGILIHAWTRSFREGART